MGLLREQICQYARRERLQRACLSADQVDLLLDGALFKAGRLDCDERGVGVGPHSDLGYTLRTAESLVRRGFGMINNSVSHLWFFTVTDAGFDIAQASSQWEKRYNDKQDKTIGTTWFIDMPRPGGAVRN